MPELRFNSNFNELPVRLRCLPHLQQRPKTPGALKTRKKQTMWINGGGLQIEDEMKILWDSSGGKPTYIELARARWITSSGEKGKSVYDGDSIATCVEAGASMVYSTSRGNNPAESWRLSREGVCYKKCGGRDFGLAAMGLRHQVQFLNRKVKRWKQKWREIKSQGTQFTATARTLKNAYDTLCKLGINNKWLLNTLSKFALSRCVYFKQGCHSKRN